MPVAFSLTLPVAKKLKNGLITGWAALSSDENGVPLVDHHNEHIPFSTIEKAAQELMKSGGVWMAGDMHTQRVGDIVSVMPLDGETAKGLGFGDGTSKISGLAVTIKLKDPRAIEMVENGERPELSIHGVAKKWPIGQRSDGSWVRALSDLRIDEISIVDQGASGNDSVAPKIVVAKRKEPEDKLDPWLVRKIKKFFSKQQEPSMTLDEILANLPEEARAVILAAIEQAKAPATPPAESVAAAAPMPAEEPKTDEELKKALAALPEPVRKQLDHLEEVQKDREELRKRVDKLEEEKEFERFLAQAKELPYLAGKSTQEVAKMLRAASKSMDAKDFESVVKMLKDGNDAVGKSALFADYGTSLRSDADTPKAKIEAVAKSLQEKDPTMTMEKAMIKAAEQNPELYEQQRKGVA